MKDGEVSTPLRVTRGWVVGTLAGNQDPYVPTWTRSRTACATTPSATRRPNW